MATGTTELEAALSRVIRLADEHARSLDSPMRCMTANAWVGGGAPAFAKALAGHRTTMQRAFQQASEQIASRIRQLGGQAPQVPTFTTSMSVMSATPTGFSGMDITAMERLVTDLTQAGHRLPEAGHHLSGELSVLCLPAAAGTQVTTAGEWAQTQVTDLRRRLSSIQQEHKSGTAPKSVAAFALFGTHAPDPSGVTTLTTAATNGDPAALKALLTLQNTGKDPTLASRLNVWWHQLSPTTRQHLIDQSPQSIGSLNGLPAATRDQANRRYLMAEKAWLGLEMARLRAAPSTEDAEKAIAEVELKVRQLAAVEMSLSLGGKNGRASAYLLQVELGGLGKTAISFGNPDDADNIVTYVPGTGTQLAEAGGDVQRAAYLWDQANFFDRDKKVASIACWDTRPRSGTRQVRTTAGIRFSI